MVAWHHGNKVGTHEKSIMLLEDHTEVLISGYCLKMNVNLLHSSRLKIYRSRILI
jgi:hypothetical protein